mgnify:CR=1 FL=1
MCQAWYTCPAEAFLEYYPHRYVIFDGNADSPLDSNGHFYWRLRPNLLTALENQELVSKLICN